MSSPNQQGSGRAVAGEIYVHPISKFAFPPQVGPFSRLEVRQYDSEGADIGVGYNSPNPTVVTVYVYPAAKNVALLPQPKDSGITQLLLDREFDLRKREILQGHRNSIMCGESAFELVQGERRLNGRRALFNYQEQFASKDQMIASELYVFLREPGVMFGVNDRHFVKYRISYPKSRSEDGEREVAGFLADFKWSF
jgi:hypothetical protein